VDHEDEGNALGLVFLRLDDGGDADLEGAKDACDLGEDARLVIDRDVEVILRDDLVDGLARAVEAVRGEAEGAARVLEGGRRFGQIADDGAGSGILACTAAIEKRVADDIALDGDGIEDALDGMRVG